MVSQFTWVRIFGRVHMCRSVFSPRISVNISNIVFIDQFFSWQSQFFLTGTCLTRKYTLLPQNVGLLKCIFSPSRIWICPYNQAHQAHCAWSTWCRSPPSRFAIQCPLHFSLALVLPSQVSRICWDCPDIRRTSRPPDREFYSRHFPDITNIGLSPPPFVSVHSFLFLAKWQFWQGTIRHDNLSSVPISSGFVTKSFHLFWIVFMVTESNLNLLKQTKPVCAWYGEAYSAQQCF